MKKRFYPLFLLFLCLLLSCADTAQKAIIDSNLQLFSGELSANSIILQCRFNATDSLINDDISGRPGTGFFELDTNAHFSNAIKTEVLEGNAENDFIIKKRITGLKPNTQYFYRLISAGNNHDGKIYSETASFKTFPSPENGRTEVSFAMSTGFNYEKFYGIGRAANGGKGKLMAAPPSPEDLALGFEAFETVANMNLDFFIANGDVVYYDSPSEKPELRAKTKPEMWAKWHRYFSMPRHKEMLKKVPVYYLKDDHDHRFNDCDTTDVKHELPTNQTGIEVFLEEVPIVDPAEDNPVTYRTFQAGKLLQIWMVEGRDYRSPNLMEDGPDKTLWGKEQFDWLKKTLLESEAEFKILVSPTPMIGPDDAYKKDNHANFGGFQHEGKAFFNWLESNDFLRKNFFIICGDRHWQYHSIHPNGFEEFSSGAFVDQNSRPGRLPGDPKSTDPDAILKVPYIQTEGKNSGGFLKVKTEKIDGNAMITFSFHNTHGKELYKVSKKALGS